jgi:uncharacterized membrane protein
MVELAVSLSGVGDDLTYPLLGAAAVLSVGVVILLKSGNKIGLVFIVAALLWGYYIMQPVIGESKAVRPSAPPASPVR